MPFPARIVGASLETVEREITARRALAYAAALGAREPAFLDDAQDGGQSVLPFLCVSLEWPALLSLRGALAGLSTDETRRGVHAAQDSHFHRPMRVGERLTTRGVVAGVRRVRSGVMTLIRLETRASDTGEPVVTSWSRSIYRDVALEGEERALADPAPAPAAAGRPLPADAAHATVPIAREAPHVYSECAQIWNPIHTERAVALAAGLPDIILHGTATWALAGLTILRAHAGGEVRRLRRLSGRFSGVVIPGEPIVVRHAPLGEGAIGFEVAAGTGMAMREGLAVLG